MSEEPELKDYRPETLSYKEAFARLADLAQIESECPCCQADPESIGAVAVLVALAVCRGEEVHEFGVGTANIMTSWRTGNHEYCLWVSGRESAHFSVTQYKPSKLPLEAVTSIHVRVDGNSARYSYYNGEQTEHGDL